MNNQKEINSISYQEAKRLLHPDTTRDAIWEIADKQEALKKINEACLLACEAMDELQKYKQIGTLDEVRDAVEKQKVKEPSPMLGIYGRVYECKECGNELEMYSKHCPFCGQKQNWE